MAYWIFKCNPEYYDLERRLLDPKPRITWTVPRYREQIKIGDIVFIWLTGLNGGIRAVLQVLSPPCQRKRLASENEYCGEIDRQLGCRLEASLTHRNVHIPPHEFRADPKTRQSDVLTGFQQATIYPVTRDEGEYICRLATKRERQRLNLFTPYAQLENQFTNGLISILHLAYTDHPRLLREFLRKKANATYVKPMQTFRVLRGITGTADGEISGPDCCIHIETKITSGTLSAVQIDRHLNSLQRGRLNRLVLLTPDNSESAYVRRFLKLDKRLRHVEWKWVYDSLLAGLANSDSGAFWETVRQFLHRIRDVVFSQDMAGIIQKISFGDWSEVYADSYLDEIQRHEWTHWNTPRLYKNLDGKGRVLMLYDPRRKEITAEGEVAHIKKVNGARSFPYRNTFVSKSLRACRKPIPLSAIRMVEGFENFGSERSAFRNLTREQYQQLHAWQGKHD